MVSCFLYYLVGADAALLHLAGRWPQVDRGDFINADVYKRQILYGMVAVLIRHNGQGRRHFLLAGQAVVLLKIEKQILHAVSYTHLPVTAVSIFLPPFYFGHLQTPVYG